MTFTREFAPALTEKRPAESTFFASGMQLQIHKLPQICPPSPPPQSGMSAPIAGTCGKSTGNQKKNSLSSPKNIACDSKTNQNQRAFVYVR